MPVRPEYANAVQQFWDTHGGVFIDIDGDGVPDVPASAPSPAGLPPQAPPPQDYGFGPIVSLSAGADNNTPQGAIETPHPSAGTVARDVGRGVEAAARSQAEMAPRSMMTAYENPTLGNITGAAVNSALAVGRPVLGAGALAVGGGAMLARDGLPALGDEVAAAVAPGPAQAQEDLPGLTKEQMKLWRKGNPGQRKRLEEISAAYVRDRQKGEQDRLNAESQARIETDRQRSLNEEKERAAAAASKRAEYDRSVETAETARDAEMGRIKRFSTWDSDWKDLYDQLGGEAGAPFSVGLMEGMAMRAALGPGATAGEKAVKDWLLPMIAGGGSGFAAANAPTAYNYFANDPDNPKKAAMETYGFNLPEGHPKKAEAIAAAARMPDENPVRSEAAKDYNDHWQERLIIGGVEGMAGAKFGNSVAGAVGRGYEAVKDGARNWFSRGGGGPTPPKGPDMSSMGGANTYRPNQSLPPSQQNAPHWARQPRTPDGRWRR